MKILIIVQSLTGGGAERVAVSWANGLDSKGHIVTILTNCNIPQTYPTNSSVSIIPFVVHSGKKVFFGKFLNKLLSFIKFGNQIRLIINKLNPDVIINVLYISSYSILLGRLTSKHHPMIIQTDHNAYERPVGVKFQKGQWRNKFIDNRFFDKVTVLTKADKEIASRTLSNVEVLHNPLFFHPVSCISPKDNIILAVGRLDAWHCKGFDILIKVWRKLYKKYPDWRLNIVGNGSLKNIKMLESLAGEAAESIQIKPFTSNIIEEYKKASVFILSSRYEGWGLVLVEALSQGCACIACDYKGRQAEIIQHGENGILCHPDNEEELTIAIENVIANEDLRLHIQSNAPDSVKRFEEEIIVSKLENIIRGVKGF